MFANLERHDADRSYKAYILNSSVVVEFDLKSPEATGQFFRGGMIGYTQDEDVSFSKISVYVNGSLSSPTENPELFGCFIGFNGAHGSIEHIYVFAELSVKGKATSLAGLMATNSLPDTKTIDIRSCVV